MSLIAALFLFRFFVFCFFFYRISYFEGGMYVCATKKKNTMKTSIALTLPRARPLTTCCSVRREVPAVLNAREILGNLLQSTRSRRRRGQDRMAFFFSLVFLFFFCFVFPPTKSGSFKHGLSIRTRIKRRVFFRTIHS